MLHFADRWLRSALLLGALTAMVLVAYGLIATPGLLSAPSSALPGAVGVGVVLGAYAVAGWLLPTRLQRRDARIVSAGAAGGLLAGLVFAGEIALEYAFLPASNALMGTVEYGLVLALLFAGSLYVAYRSRSMRSGLLAALLSAAVAALIWYSVVLIVFYLFRGTPQQAQVFRAEGNYDDFARSGMASFDAWIMEDFLGAGFFHLLLLPLIAAVLGLAGGALGKGLARLRRG
jgi:hypothetical protein